MRRATVAAAAVVVMLLAGCGGDDDTAEGDERGLADLVETTTTTEPAPETTTTTRPPTTTTTLPPPLPEHFAVSLVVTESRCFNSAGANVTVEPELSYTGPGLPDGGEWQIIYEIHGGEVVETFSFDVTSDGDYSYRPHLVQTPTCSDTLTATVVNVRER